MTVHSSVGMLMSIILNIAYLNKNILVTFEAPRVRRIVTATAAKNDIFTSTETRIPYLIASLRDGVVASPAAATCCLKMRQQPCGLTIKTFVRSITLNLGHKFSNI